MDDASKPDQVGDGDYHRYHTFADFHVVVEILILGQEAKFLAEAKVADDIEREELSPVAPLHGAEIVWRGHILAFNEIYELEDELVNARLVTPELPP